MRRYQPVDYFEIASWFEARGEVPPSPSFLPRTGFIEPGVAVGFLTSTDTAVCWLGDFVSNPAAPRLTSGRAIEAITQRLLQESDALGFGGVVVMTRVPSVQRFTERMAFRNLGDFAMMSRVRESGERDTSGDNSEAST